MNHFKFFIITFLSAYGFCWAAIASSSYFGWVDLHKTGIKGHLILLLFSIILAVILSYLHFYITNSELEKQKSISNVENSFPQVIDFKDTFKNINWVKLIEESEYSIDIVVYYFDSWVNQNEEVILKFLLKPKTKIRVFVSDPDNPLIIENVLRLFPESSEEIIKAKITHTKDRFLNIYNKAGASTDRFEFYYYPHFLNYSCQIFDNKFAVLSVFEMYRKQKIDSPAILIDLERSRHMKEYFAKELTGILSESNRK